MELILVSNELMPGGSADFEGVIKYPKISKMVEEIGKKKMLAILVLLVKDFCSSVNVVRNMNEDQMIEAAAMLLEECDNFRLEDYFMMFSMAKKGKFKSEVKIWDRMDIQIISEILDEYWKVRKTAGKAIMQKEQEVLDNISFDNPQDRKQLIFDGEKGYVEQKNDVDKIHSFGSALAEISASFKNEYQPNLTEADARKQLFTLPKRELSEKEKEFKEKYL